MKKQLDKFFTKNLGYSTEQVKTYKEETMYNMVVIFGMKDAFKDFTEGLTA